MTAPIDRQKEQDTRPSARIESACQYTTDMLMVERMTGHEPKREMVMWAAHLHGYDYATEHAHGELLAENLELHSRLHDRDAEDGRLGSPEKLIPFGEIECFASILKHGDDCDCDYCKGIDALVRELRP